MSAGHCITSVCGSGCPAACAAAVATIVAAVTVPCTLAPRALHLRARVHRCARSSRAAGMRAAAHVLKQAALPSHPSQASQAALLQAARWQERHPAPAADAARCF